MQFERRPQGAQQPCRSRRDGLVEGIAREPLPHLLRCKYRDPDHSCIDYLASTNASLGLLDWDVNVSVVCDKDMCDLLLHTSSH
jgi:hypothetical protein